MEMLKYIIAMFTITGIMFTILYFFSESIDFSIFFAIIILLAVLVILCYFIDDKIKTISDDNDTIKTNCRNNVTNLTGHVNTLNLNIKALRRDINWLSKKWEIIESTALENLFEGTKDTHPSYIKQKSYLLTEEGEMALPKELKERIKHRTHKVKLESPEDAFNLLTEIGRDKLKEFAKESKLQFYEIIALSTLYAIKVSKEGE